MRPIRVTVGPLATASPTAVAASQSVTAGNSVVITNGTLDMPRRLLITSAGSDTGITFAITGTNWSGSPVGETLTGGSASAVPSVLDYATVTSIKPSGATASTITVGTNTVASSAWVALDVYGWPTAGLQFEASSTGTVNYTLEQSFDNPNDPVAPIAVASMRWAPALDVVNLTADTLSNYAYGVPRFCRVTLNSGTGSVTMIAAQSGGMVS